MRFGRVRPQAGYAFCSYCGLPPDGEAEGVSYRVCGRCQAGVTLHASRQMAPLPSDAFLIVEPDLTVQTLSRHAETLLSVDRDASAGVSLSKLVIPADGSPAIGLARLIDLALADRARADTLELCISHAPEVRLQGRVGNCGLPAGALLVLTPLDSRMRAGETGRRRRGRPTMSVRWAQARNRLRRRTGALSRT